MAAGKKSFVLYSDQKELFESLPDEQAGKLIKHIFNYVNDENPISEDALVNLAFISVKASLKRDLQKWEKQIEQRSAAGKASAEKRKQALTESNENQRPLKVVNEAQRNSTDNVSVSVSDNVSVNEIKEKDIPASGFDFLTSLLDLGVDKQVAQDWMKVRAKHKASNTLTAFKKISAEINKSGRDANWCITKAVEKSWRGFEAGWIEPEPVKKSAYPPFKIAL